MLCQAIAKANVLATNVDIDEPPNRAVLFAETVLQARERLAKLTPQRVQAWMNERFPPAGNLSGV